jgi:hypothetical protein
VATETTLEGSDETAVATTAAVAEATGGAENVTGAETAAVMIGDWMLFANTDDKSGAQ